MIGAFALGVVACDASSVEAPATPEPRISRPEEADGGVTTAKTASPLAPSQARAEPTLPPYEPREEDRVAPHMPLENPEVLAPFYDRLASLDDETEAGLVRVLHLGDSVLGADGITGALRRRFQTRFGDGGPGLVLLQRYMKNYRHTGVDLRAKGWEFCYVIYLCQKDGHYGLGGATFWSTGGAQTTYRTLKEGLGSSVSRYELWYMTDPRGGKLELRVDGGPPEVIDTRADAAEDRYHTLDVKPGPHRLRVRAAGGGKARAYGVVMETDGSGVVWDSFSMLGAFTKRLLLWPPEHVKSQLSRRDPDLLVLSYGGNDLRRVVIREVTGPAYIEEYLEVIDYLRAAAPDVPCLITTLGDHGRILIYDVVPKQTEVIVAAQREVARRAGCAFFDTYTAMGGPGSIYDWRDQRPALASKDLKHFSPRGHRRVAGWIYDAIIAGYVAHRRER